MTSYAASIGFDILEIEFSPIKGPEGNIEYLVHLKKTQELSGKDSGTESGDGRGQCIRYVGKISGDKAWIHFIS